VTRHLHSSDAGSHEIAGRAKQLSRIAIETLIIFNNNKGSYAPSAADRLRRIVARQGTTVGA
jgi:hypothetical protein